MADMWEVQECCSAPDFLTANDDPVWQANVWLDGRATMANTSYYFAVPDLCDFISRLQALKVPASGIKVHIYASGCIQIACLILPASLLDRLQSLKALARQHFGEDWGK